MRQRWFFLHTAATVKYCVPSSVGATYHQELKNEKMLNQLSIKNFAIIDELHLSFGEGLNVISGETGAGKSIIIGAVSLLLGDLAARGGRTCLVGPASAVGCGLRPPRDCAALLGLGARRRTHCATLRSDSGAESVYEVRCAHRPQPCAARRALWPAKASPTAPGGKIPVVGTNTASRVL